MHCFTPFERDISHISLPTKFTFPFCYEPHDLAKVAAEQLQQSLLTQDEWQHSFDISGKMFGVLVVNDALGNLGYLSAFSGKLADKNHLAFFVPPVFDILTEGSFFLEESAPINAINQQIENLEQAPDLILLKQQLGACEQQAKIKLEQLRQQIIENRKYRKTARAQAETQGLTPKALEKQFAELAKQSVAEKAQQRSLKAEWSQKIQQLKTVLNLQLQQIEHLKQQRKDQSSILQKKLFKQYKFLNKDKRQKSLLDIFVETANPTPPAGSGECAAPKLLQYAFKHDLKPIALAEFWWGASPKSEIRQHKKYYPACQSKCLPILTHMLNGMKLDENPLLNNPAEGKDIEIIYQDEAIVVINKPTEFLSVPGVNVKDSAYGRLQLLFPNVEGPFVLHRLDMSTSGLLVFALTHRANKSLQKQFITRKIKKRYVALLDGKVPENKGEITLPLRGDLDDKPRQMVCFEHGKPAHTSWQLIEYIGDKSKVYLFPKTGRTHQLRVHCAHQDGLNMPIIGDDLYGEKTNRLHLHAQQLTFEHPYTKQVMVFEIEAGF